jgi:hypothetical protein
MSQKTLWHQIESDRQLIQALPRGQQDALKHETSWSTRSGSGYKFDRPKNERGKA